MNTHLPVLMLALLLGGGQAITPAQTTHPQNPNTPGTTPAPLPMPKAPPLTPQQMQQAREYYAPPRVVSTSMTYAVNLILNEKTGITGMTGGLPRELATALDRAALHIPVKLAVGGGQRLRLQNVQQYVQPSAAPNTIIATQKNTITFSGGKLQVWESGFQADQVRQSLAPFLTNSR